MALPLLALGMGLLGGAKYLQSKADERDATDQLNMAQSMLASNPEWAAQNPMYQQMVQEQQAGMGFMQNDAVQASALTKMIQDQQQADAAEAQRQQERIRLCR